MAIEDNPMHGQEHLTQFALLVQDVGRMAESIDEIRKDLKKQYVTRNEFDIRVGRVEKLVYGGVGIILIGALGAMLTLIFR